MPVSYLPLLLPLVFLVLLVQGAIRGRRALFQAVAIVCAIVAMVALPAYAPGWVLMLRARGGDPHVMYRLAKWHDTHCSRINEVILWPCVFFESRGYEWLEAAAEENYPPALDALGVRLKYGFHVPKPPGWRGPSGNVFDQPERGQKYIDKAIELGFKPIVEEKYFYNHVYHEMYQTDPNG